MQYLFPVSHGIMRLTNQSAQNAITANQIQEQSVVGKVGSLQKDKLGGDNATLQKQSIHRTAFLNS